MLALRQRQKDTPSMLLLGNGNPPGISNHTLLWILQTSERKLASSVASLSPKALKLFAGRHTFPEEF